MALWRCMLLGAAGGAVIEVLALMGYALAWQQARRTPGGTVKKFPPPMHSYVDMPAHVSLLLIRMILGAVAAGIFADTGQISGPYAALALGAAAPAVLTQVGRVPQVEQMVKGKTRGKPPSAPATRAARIPSEEVEHP